MASQPLDSLDLKLLQALELDGRAPFSRIGEVLGVSDQTVARGSGACAARCRCG